MSLDISGWMSNTLQKTTQNQSHQFSISPLLNLQSGEKTFLIVLKRLKLYITFLVITEEQYYKK